MTERALVVRGPFRGPTGHDHHVREFVRSFVRHGTRVQLIDVPEWSPARLPIHLADPWFEGLQAPVASDTVLHFCMPPQVTVAGGRRDVNYTMFEATRVPAAWIDCSRRLALVVVPTESSRAAWVAGGLPAERVRVCPLGVDTKRFRPGLPARELVDRRGRRVAEYRTRVLNVSAVTPRKNLSGLLRVWLRATRVEDDVILVMKLGRHQPGRTVALLRDLEAVERAVGRSRRLAASILFVDQVFADHEMPGLFASATHYWSMSHGEGWDQPMVEAAATGLRLIAPAHSAYLEYLDPSIARLIPARQVPARVEGDAALAALFAGAEWWEPNEDAAVEAVRDAIAGRDRDRPLAGPRFAANLTWDRATEQLFQILDQPDAPDRAR
jgi:glycosyltransferase involved in cell wall biosynthesis